MEMQQMYEKQTSFNGKLEPTELVEKVGRIINTLKFKNPSFIQNTNVIFENKKTVPMEQLFALYAINKISSIANGK